MTGGDRPPALACHRCGSPAGAGSPGAGSYDEGPAPLTWVRSVEGGAVRWYCPACARAGVRAIEGRLDLEWW